MWKCKEREGQVNQGARRVQCESKGKKGEKIMLNKSSYAVTISKSIIRVLMPVPEIVFIMK